MKKFRNNIRNALAALVAALLCARLAHVRAADAAAFASPSDLTTTLVDAANIELRWKNNATEAGGNWIEFTTPGDDFVKLDAGWMDLTTYRHENLAPRTKYMYRIRPFFGRTSEMVEVNVGHESPGAGVRQPSRVKGSFLGTPDPDTEGPLEDLPNESGTNSPPKKSIRATSTAAEGAPAGFTATVAGPTSIDLRWQDRASDEDGYLVEISPDKKLFTLCALLPADSTSFRKARLPADTKCYFRVRAFFYGTPSNVASIATGAESPAPARAEARKPKTNSTN